MSEIIIGVNMSKEEKEDRVYELVESFTIGQTILGRAVELKKKPYPDGGFVLKVMQNEHYDFLEVKYGEIQINVNFTLHPGVDDKLIEQMKKLAEADKDDWDRFWINEEKNSYGAILIGYDQFEELFPKMYSHS
ncbi:MAG: hypothetical protein K0R18_202 [Bacillales bacterium]|nr:hypothetical protein [Bacillales bacterium]